MLETGPKRVKYARYTYPGGPIPWYKLIGICSFIFLARTFFNKGVALVKESTIYFMNKKGHKLKPCFLRESKFLIWKSSQERNSKFKATTNLLHVSWPIDLIFKIWILMQLAYFETTTITPKYGIKNLLGAMYHTHSTVVFMLKWIINYFWNLGFVPSKFKTLKLGFTFRN